MEALTRKLGPYRLIRELGSGAFGSVWLAEKSTPIARMEVALKLARDKNIDHETLKREAAIWIQAGGHPNVLRLIDADIYANQVVIVSEYAPDGSLSDWLKRHGGSAPSIEAASEMIDGVLAGLTHLHARRVIHRDLKPDNILLQGNSPLLADFGISRLLVSSSYSLTIGGTPVYMAPEAFSYKRNERTDIWSVGIIFYQLLTGRLPYYHSDVNSLKDAITQHDAPPLPKSIPEVLRRVVEKALQRDSARRYGSAAEMRRDLREADFALRLANRSTLPTPRAESPASTLASTLPLHGASTPPAPAPRMPVQKRATPQQRRSVPTLGQRFLAAFWIFWGERPELPYQVKLKRLVRRKFWAAMKAACLGGIFIVPLFMSDNRQAIETRGAAIAAFLTIVSWFLLLFVYFGIDSAVSYLRNPTEKPEILNSTEVDDLLWDDPSSRRWRAVTVVVLLIEILCVLFAAAAQHIQSDASIELLSYCFSAM